MCCSMTALSESGPTFSCSALRSFVPMWLEMWLGDPSCLLLMNSNAFWVVGHKSVAPLCYGKDFIFFSLINEFRWLRFGSLGWSGWGPDLKPDFKKGKRRGISAVFWLKKKREKEIWFWSYCCPQVWSVLRKRFYLEQIGKVSSEDPRAPVRASAPAAASFSSLIFLQKILKCVFIKTTHWEWKSFCLAHIVQLLFARCATL